MAGQSDSHLSLFSPEEVEFMAEDELVEIVPNLRMDSLNFICGDYGPFYPQIPAQVPLWLAVALKKRGKCTIRTPQWMSIENLTQVLEGERDSHAFQSLPFHYVEISRLLFDHARDDIPAIYMVRSLIEDIRDVRFHKVETNLEKFTASTVTVFLKLISLINKGSEENDFEDRLVILNDLRSINLVVLLKKVELRKEPHIKNIWIISEAYWKYTYSQWKNMSAMEVNIIREFAGRALQAFYRHENEQLMPDADRTQDRQPQVPTVRPKRNLKPR